MTLSTLRYINQLRLKSHLNEKKISKRLIVIVEQVSLLYSHANCKFKVTICTQ